MPRMRRNPGAPGTVQRQASALPLVRGVRNGTPSLTDGAVEVWGEWEVSKGRRTVDPVTGLTANMEAFCVELARTGNASEAYRKAYRAGNMKPETIAKRALELQKNGKITGRLAQLRAEVRKTSGITLEEHMTSLKALRNAAAQAKQFGPAVSAEMARGKVSGLYDSDDDTGDAPAPVKVEISVVDGRRQA